MSSPTLTAASWISFLAGSTAAERAAAWAAFGVDTIEFLDASDSVIRTVTCGAWSVGSPQGGSYPVIPGVFTDSATGSGTPVTAVFKAGSTEKWRCSCGTAESNFYRLRANIVAGVPISRGPFAVLIGPPPSAGNAQPTNTTAPVISGTASVGQVLTCTPGVWTGNPVPTVTRQWYRGATAISGATGLAYTLVSADFSALITCRESATNIVSTITANSNTLGPVSSGALAFTPPATFDLARGGTYSLAQHVSGGVPPYGPYELDSGTLPAGVTLNSASGVLSATGSATLGESGTLVIGVSDSAVSATLPTFSVLSAVGGSNLPFTYGHAFKEGDVPSGSYVNSDLTDWQAIPTTYWPDGSLRHAIIAGRATCSANVLKNITLSVSGTNRTGTALTEANLSAVMPTVTLQAGGDSFTLNSLIGTAARHRTVCSGPVMSNWLYRRAIAGSNHLVAWFDVRLYIGGAVEIFPWVENCYLTVANPAADTRTYTLTIGGVTKFSATNLRVCHHTRIPLIDNAASSWKHWSYWTGADPQIEPKHDAAYLMATKLSPNFGWTPSATALNGLVQSYSPNSTVGMTSFQTSGGDNSALLGHSRNYADPCYAKLADARAFRGMMAHALSGGSWSSHFRAEASSTQGAAGTPNEPIKFSVYPDASYNDGGSPQINWTSDGVVNAPLGNMWGFTTHQPSYGFLAWLCTGRWWFLDEMLFWATNNYLQCMGGQRDSVNGIMKSNVGAHTDRGAAWSLRTLAQALAIVPTTHPLHAELKASWEANTAKYYGWVVSGSIDGGVYVNNLGFLPKYCPPGVWGAVNGTFSSAGYGDCSGYMQHMLVMVFGYSSDLGLPQSATSLSNHLAVRDHAYKLPVGMAGAGDPDAWDYRWFGPYAVMDSVLNTRFMNDWNEAYDATKAVTGVAPSGTALLRPATTTAWADPTYLSSFFGQHLAALAYAVDHGAPGAAAAWARVSAASNFASYTAGFADIPYYGIAPRSA